VNRQPLPKLQSTPMYCCVAGPWRMLEWGVFSSKAAAVSKAAAMCKGASAQFRVEIGVERIYVSRRQR
jgi:hypothetical protein